MLVAGLVGCVRDDTMKGQETASFQYQEAVGIHLSSVEQAGIM